MNETTSKKKWVAIITTVFSVAIGVVYLILITILDSRGPMNPPPPEALGVVGVDAYQDFVEVQQLVE